MGLALCGHALNASFFEKNAVCIYTFFAFTSNIINTSISSHCPHHLQYHSLKSINSLLTYQQWPLSLRSPTANSSFSPSKASIKLPNYQLCRWYQLFFTPPIFRWPILLPQTFSPLATKDTLASTATTTTAPILPTDTLYGTAVIVVMVLWVPGSPLVLPAVTPYAVLAP